MLDRYESTDERGAFLGKLSSVEPTISGDHAHDDEAHVVPEDGGLVPRAALRRLRIPGKLTSTIRRRVHLLYDECPWLQQSNIDLVLAYVWRCDRIVKKTAVLDKLPPTRVDRGDVAERQLDEALRADVKLLLAMEAALCISPQARASLGIDVGRLRRLSVSEPPADDVDVAELERRYVEQVRG